MSHIKQIIIRRQGYNAPEGKQRIQIPVANDSPDCYEVKVQLVIDRYILESQQKDTSIDEIYETISNHLTRLVHEAYLEGRESIQNELKNLLNIGSLEGG
jgi:hypothetical protein